MINTDHANNLCSEHIMTKKQHRHITTMFLHLTDVQPTFTKLAQVGYIPNK